MRLLTLEAVLFGSNTVSIYDILSYLWMIPLLRGIIYEEFNLNGANIFAALHIHLSHIYCK